MYVYMCVYVGKHKSDSEENARPTWLFDEDDKTFKKVPCPDVTVLIFVRVLACNTHTHTRLRHIYVYGIIYIYIYI
jgi:hypothetical protein